MHAPGDNAKPMMPPRTSDAQSISNNPDTSQELQKSNSHPMRIPNPTHSQGLAILTTLVVLKTRTPSPEMPYCYPKIVVMMIRDGLLHPRRK
jgi:hypothetical protein